VLGTLSAAAHACTLGLLSIGCRRYFPLGPRRCLFLYYVLPLAPLIFLIASHIQFAYGGANANWHQLYVAILSIPLWGSLLWLSAQIYKTSYPETLQCLLRARRTTLSGPIERSILREIEGTVGASSERAVALIGDSLSMKFHVSSLPAMIVSTKRSWKTNWFVSLPVGRQFSPSVLTRLSALGTITGTQHASIGAMVDPSKRSVLTCLPGNYHFSHQVDEVLVGRFPDILLLWFGNKRSPYLL